MRRTVTLLADAPRTRQPTAPLGRPGLQMSRCSGCIMPLAALLLEAICMTLILALLDGRQGLVRLATRKRVQLLGVRGWRDSILHECDILQ